MMNARRITIPAALAAVGLALAGCVDDEALLPAPEMTAEQELLSRYVSLGNSITAGFQSGGIVESTQANAYPAILAQAAGVPFGIPALAHPGCPPPFAEPLGPTRIDGSVEPSCALRTPGATFFVQNLAVPGAAILDLFDVLTPGEGGGAEPVLSTLILGGRSQIEAMHEADPSLVSVWIGNNDALTAAVSGVTALLTPLAEFEAGLDRLVAEINQTDARGVVLIGVVDAVVAAPILQPGAYFWAIWQMRDDLPPAIRERLKPVSDTCAPLGPDGPNPLAANMVSFRILADANFPAISCDPEDYPPASPHLLTLQEQEVVRERIAAYNEAIEARVLAQHSPERPWIYVDPNEVQAPYLAQGPPYDFVRKCQDLLTAQTREELEQAVLLSCPVPPEMGGPPNFFGTLLSLDGVHPGTEAHHVVAAALANELNAAFGLSLGVAVP